MTFDGKGGGVDHDYLTSMGGGLLMTIDDKVERGVKKGLNLDDIVVEQPLK